MRFPDVTPFLPGSGEPSLRWGVLAPGGIARSFVASVLKHTNQRVLAAGSRSLENAQAFAAEHGLERAYGSYDELLADDELDAIYVASPHSLHVEHGLMVIAAGKHLLVEKPIATNAADARLLLDAARAAGVFATEAMWTRYLPQSAVIRAVLDAGMLGEVRQLFADHGQAITHIPRLVQPELAGGAMLDLGIYPFSFASQWLGNPSAVTATGARYRTGVDEWVSAVLQYESGAAATLSTTMATVTPNTASINGTEARLELAGTFYAPTSLRLVDTKGESAQWHDDTGIRDHEGLSWQATAVARFVGEGLLQSPLHPHDEIVAVLATMGEALRQLP